MIHNVGVDYCSCGQTGGSQVEQLLEHRLYPATLANPKTAATFRALELFEILQYESKLTPYEFYNTISRLTDNTGLHVVKVSTLPYTLRTFRLTEFIGPISKPCSYGPSVEARSTSQARWERP